MKNAIFLDRDGIINKNDPVFAKNVSYYIDSWKNFIFIKGIFKPLRKISNSNYLIIIISNQPGVAKEKFSLEILNDITNKMNNNFLKEGIKIDKVYYCIHKEEDNCKCRKPKPGLLIKAKKEFNIDMQNSYFIGDKTTDIFAGKKAGCKTVIIKTGYKGNDGRCSVSPDYSFKNLNEFTNFLLK